VGVEEGVVDVLVGLVDGGVEAGLRGPEAGEGFSPFVIPAQAGIHEHGGVRFGCGGVHGFRVKPGMTGWGMTNQRRGADGA
jgi:hypothetical protein